MTQAVFCTALLKILILSPVFYQTYFAIKRITSFSTPFTPMKKLFLLLYLPCIFLLVLPSFSSCQTEDTKPADPSSDSPGNSLPAELEGSWRDSWSLWNNHKIYDDLYNATTKKWFGGYTTPWDLQPDPANGVYFDKQGNFVWVVLSSTRPYPGSGCWVTTAEFISGKAEIKGDKIQFKPSVRRQMYHSVCNPTQDFDREREHALFEVSYKVYPKTEDDGTQLKVIRLINPDQSFTEYFAR